jgi:hypothetical protein
VLDRAAGLLGGLVLRVLRLEDDDLLEAHGFSYVFFCCGGWLPHETR